MAALAIASSLLARLFAAAPVTPKSADTADPIPILDALFPKLFGELLGEARADHGSEAAGTVASADQAGAPTMATGAVAVLPLQIPSTGLPVGRAQTEWRWMQPVALVMPGGDAPAVSSVALQSDIPAETAGPVLRTALVGTPPVNTAPVLRAATVQRKPVLEPDRKQAAAIDLVPNGSPIAPAFTMPPTPLPREAVPEQKTSLAPERDATPSSEPGQSVVKSIDRPAPVPDGAQPDPVRTTSAVEIPKLVGAAEVQVVARSAAETAEIAFTAQLTPVVATERTTSEAEHRLQRLILDSAPPPPPDSDHTPAPKHSTAAASQEPVRAVVARSRRQDPPPQAPHEQPVTATNHAGQYPQTAVQSYPEAALSTERPAEQPEAAGTTRPEAPPEPPKTLTPAREIRLALGGGEQRVEVKVSDRGGEVQVAVRTVDGHLAERLRENLPVLTSRLAESGIRAETWHPPASGSTDWRETKEISSASSADSSDPQPQQDNSKQDRDREPQRPRIADENDQPKEKGKDFTWLMSTLP